jgi:hypothetical protein
MIVYRVIPDRANKKVFVYEEDLWALTQAGKTSAFPEDIFESQPRQKAADWHPPGIRWYDDDGRNIQRYKDPDITQIDLLSYLLGPRAAELLRPVISDVAELLPVPFQGETWYFMNVFHRADALDKANSHYMVYSTGEVSRALEKPAFFADKVPHAKLFMLTGVRGRVYYAEHHPDDNPNTFKGAVEKNKLFGIRFGKVWEN